MAIRKYKPTTPGRRQSSVSEFSEVTRSTPEKSLLRPLSKTGGRNVHGHITTRHKGGGHKRQYRVIDFRRNDKDGIPAKVAHIEYDPNRTANIALLHYADGEKRYIIAPKNLKQGAIVESGANADIKVGNNLPLRNIRPVPPFTVWSSSRVPAHSWHVLLVLLFSFSVRKVSTQFCVCRPLRSVASTLVAVQPSVRSETRIRSTFVGARPAVCAGRAGARLSAVLL